MTSSAAVAEVPGTFALEAFAADSINYYESLVDRDGLPYFNVFWTEPAEAAHDWPDFGDVMSRQLQAVIMARHMTGRRTRIETVWLEKVLGYIDPATGLLARPETSFTVGKYGGADYGDASLTLYALVTAYLDSGDRKLRQAVRRMVDGILRMPFEGQWIPGFMIKSLMAAGRAIDYEPAIEHAGRIVHFLFKPGGYFPPDNRLPPVAHMHGTLRTLVGAADWALHTGDPVIFGRVLALYEFTRTITTRFGFMCEAYRRPADVVACETCAIMDYVGLGATLANHGHPIYWGDVERCARNHLVESQIKDGSWLCSPADPLPDTDQFTWRDIARRAVGAYSGWSAPNHILACKENLHWGGPELRGKPRALQNCCGGSGTHALFIVWKNAARFEDGKLRVNMHIDKLLPEAEVRCFQPYRGLLRIRLKTGCDVVVRIPEFVKPSEIRVETRGAGGMSSGGSPSEREQEPVICGDYVELGKHKRGTVLDVWYPLPVHDEEVAVGNPGFRQYRYRVTWKGDTVVRMQPMGNDYRAGYSNFEECEVPVYYGEDGPGPLYQREQMLADVEPHPSPIHRDDGQLDFWRIS